MGEYADMSVGYEFSDYIDRRFGSYYEDENDFEEQEDVYINPNDLAPKSDKFYCFEISDRIKETEKSNLVKLKNGREIWVSKKLSAIKDNILCIEKWYYKKIIRSISK